MRLVANTARMSVSIAETNVSNPKPGQRALTESAARSVHKDSPKPKCESWQTGALMTSMHSHPAESFELKTLKFFRYMDQGAKGCMEQDEEFQACPSADCHWGA